MVCSQREAEETAVRLRAKLVEQNITMELDVQKSLVAVSRGRRGDARKVRLDACFFCAVFRWHILDAR